jgi:hypothetical protein
MENKNHPEEVIQDIKQMMEKSSRFASLSGWSGVAAGLCGLAGAYVAKEKLKTAAMENNPSLFSGAGLLSGLIITGIITFLSALALAFFFTYLQSRKTKTPLWGYMAKKVMINFAIPMIAGGLVVFRLLQLGYYDLIAPACLLFYGLALINTGKYTQAEISYLGIAQWVLGSVTLWLPQYGLYSWAIGFGVLHIIYGIVMWWKYEREK